MKKVVKEIEILINEHSRTRGLPKNKALIKYLSEDGVRTLLQKTHKLVK